MEVVLTDINEPFTRYKKSEGKLTLQELKIWPGWTYPRMLFSYQKNGEKAVHTVNFKGTITYIFEDIAKLIHSHLNAKEKVAHMYYNKKIVILTIIKG